MPDILFYSAVTRVQTEDTFVVEYHFTVGALPVLTKLVVHRSHNDATFEQLLHEAVRYARQHYTMLEERSN